MTETLKIAALCGSLREASLNRAMLNAAAELAPDGMSVTVHRLNDIPGFNEEIEAQGWPPAVKALRDAITAADGVIFGTPEYNFSIPGVLKNAIDWLSRPAGKAPLFRKPCAILGASQGAFGTIRAQMHLREICHYNAMPTLAKPEILIMKAGEKFADGKLTDETTGNLIKDAMSNFATLIHTQKGDKA